MTRVTLKEDSCLPAHSVFVRFCISTSTSEVLKLNRTLSSVKQAGGVGRKCRRASRMGTMLLVRTFVVISPNANGVNFLSTRREVSRQASGTMKQW